MDFVIFPSKKLNFRIWQYFFFDEPKILVHNKLCYNKFPKLYESYLRTSLNDNPTPEQVFKLELYDKNKKINFGLNKINFIYFDKGSNLKLTKIQITTNDSYTCANIYLNCSFSLIEKIRNYLF